MAGIVALTLLNVAVVFRFDVATFVRDVLFMSDETRRRWTYQYWQTDWRPPSADAETPQADAVS